MKPEIMRELVKPLPIHEKPGKKQQYKYVKSSDVIDRMNTVFSGYWSTETISHERIGDEVLIQVRVMLYEDSAVTYHDGFGSAKIIAGVDIGNSYKSAEAKAIRNACSRWGVGLSMEEVDDHDASIGTNLSTQPQHIPSPPSSKVAVSPPAGTAFPPQFEQPKSSTVPFPAFNIPVPPSVSEKNNPVPSQTGFATPPTPPTTVAIEASNSQTVEMISDVQKAALDGIIKARNLTFESIVAEALPDYKVLPAESKDLTYQEAVKVIKYTNDKFRPKKGN